MSFVDDPIKLRRAFWVTLSLLIVFFLSTVALGFFSYQSVKKYQSLYDENLRLTTSVLPTPTPSATASTLDQENADLKLENHTLEEQLAAKNTKIAKAKTYNDFFQYMNSVIEAHNGFDGWTEAEYQIAYNKAQATGDNAFTGVVDAAWHDADGDPTTRILRVLKTINEGIANNLK